LLFIFKLDAESQYTVGIARWKRKTGGRAAFSKLYAPNEALRDAHPKSSCSYRRALIS
jgi:hypothetical protein